MKINPQQMYTIDRDWAAKILNVSTRTIDRYVKSKKIRSQKKWKKVFLNDQDISILVKWWIQESYEIIRNDEDNWSWFDIRPIEWVTNIDSMYREALMNIEKKDEIIKDLSYRLWKAEIELKNSIPVLEYKKTTFLLESSTKKQEEEKKELTDKVDNLKEKIKNQEFLNIILIIVFTILFLVVLLIWFANL